MPGGVTGREVSAAFVKAPNNSWGVTTAVTKGIYLTSDGGMKPNPDIITDPSFGQRFLGPSEVGNQQAVAFTLEKQARYHDHGFILEALAMGSPAAVTLSNSVSGQTASFQHVIDLAQNINGLSITFAIDKSVHVEEMTSAKVHGWSIENGDGGVMRQTFQLLGSKPTITGTTNTPGAIAAASFPTLDKRLQMQQGVFRMNVNSGNTLASTDAVDLEGIKFSFSRPQDAPNVFGQQYCVEPADNGFPTFDLELSYPRMTAASASSTRAALEAGTAWKADWTFTGVSINATDSYQFKLQFPYLQIVEWEAPTSGANQIKPKVKLAARLAPTSPSGMPFLNPMRLTRITNFSFHAFA